MQYRGLHRWVLLSCLAIFVASTAPAMAGKKQNPNRRYLTAQTDAPKRTGYLIATDQNKSKPAYFEFQTAPIILSFASWITLDGSYRFADNWSTGPSTVIYAGQGDNASMLAPSNKGYAVGWHLNYFFRSAFTSSWYVSTHAFYESYKSHSHASNYFAEQTGGRVNVVGGYRWRWGWFNMRVGGGAEAAVHDVKYSARDISFATDLPSDGNQTRSMPYIEYKLGFEI